MGLNLLVTYFLDQTHVAASLQTRFKVISEKKLGHGSNGVHFSGKFRLMHEKIRLESLGSDKACHFRVCPLIKSATHLHRTWLVPSFCRCALVDEEGGLGGQTHLWDHSEWGRVPCEAGRHENHRRKVYSRDKLRTDPHSRGWIRGKIFSFFFLLVVFLIGQKTQRKGKQSDKSHGLSGRCFWMGVQPIQGENHRDLRIRWTQATLYLQCFVYRTLSFRLTKVYSKALNLSIFLFLAGVSILGGG